MSPLTLNALLAFILGWVFVIIGLQGYRSIRTSEDYFLAGRTVGTVDFGRSFAAASTSLATVLVFFVTLGIDNGIYILYAPITYCLGVIIFVRVLLPKIEAHGFFRLLAKPQVLGLIHWEAICSQGIRARLLSWRCF